MEDIHKYKSHNKSLLVYHFVCPAKYRRPIFTSAVEKTLVEICHELGAIYEIEFIEIGADKDHVHFLVQSVPMNSPKKIVQRTKSITARELYRRHPEIEKKLWGGKLWTSGYYINTVGQYGNADVIRKYVENQGKDYKTEYKQLSLFKN